MVLVVPARVHETHRAFFIVPYCNINGDDRLVAADRNLRTCVPLHNSKSSKEHWQFQEQHATTNNHIARNNRRSPGTAAPGAAALPA